MFNLMQKYSEVWDTHSDNNITLIVIPQCLKHIVDFSSLTNKSSKKLISLSL